ncbi:hypothetical protein VHEMI00828 [[Torrubiella] hemipterigena]|uniref:Uncharacterized protein n=1 Tax=[Torrubiella] hemipterigena TaxID=1531966 RepID=A0A0A1SRJ3_9HYPO|nr:hypothetical protein VHEMI00828 [[Torrubiella] hemipterigena]
MGTETNRGMATPSADGGNSPDNAPAHQRQHSCQPHLSEPARTVADRVGTPLGLVINAAPIASTTVKPETITPAPSASPVHTDHHKSAAHGSEAIAPAEPKQDRSSIMTATSASTNATIRDDNQAAATEVFPSMDEIPLHTGTVQSTTKIVHPKPINAAAPSEVPTRPGTAVSNVAQLEATAVRLSMTSSIDDAIRDLHGELKRSDSRRSSMLAASLKDEPITGQLTRHLSTSSANASRHAGYLKSPGSLAAPGRMRSSSNRSIGYEPEVPSLLSRNGPGKSSVRSVRSVKPSLAEISESEPTSAPKTADVDNGLVETSHGLGLEPAFTTSTPAEPTQPAPVPSTDAFHAMMNSAFEFSSSGQSQDKAATVEHPERPSSTRSHDTFSQSQNAFADFDGVHCDYDQAGEDEAPQSAPADMHFQEEGYDYFDLGIPEQEHIDEADMVEPPILQPIQPTAIRRERPQSYMDPQTGIEMFYYPAKVPAMLNRPRKLSSKPKAVERNERQQKVLSAMWTGDGGAKEMPNRRHSAMPKMATSASAGAGVRQSWLPDLRRQYRSSFMALPGEAHPEFREHEPVTQPGAEEPEQAQEEPLESPPPADTLRRPKRISHIDDRRKARLSQLPSQLRASAFFDAPVVSPDIEIKDGSAMRTLDHILDVSATAPVSAFTDHLYAGPLGSEVYGKEKKRQSTMTLSPSLASVGSPTELKTVKSRSSFMWLGKRSSSYNSQEIPKAHSVGGRSLLDPAESNLSSPKIGSEPARDEGHSIHSPGQPVADNAEHAEPGHAATGEHEAGLEAAGEELMEEEEEEDDAFFGPPTTLLAELQLRKQQQKDRTKQRFLVPSGTRATLLEMDAVAETQRKGRQTKRVNLAWEDPNMHLDQNGSDDEDVPLAILAAKQHGAKNMADVERPVGLMERRDMEDNEPLSQRRARLQGLDLAPQQIRPTTMIFSPSRLGDPNPSQLNLPTIETPVEEEIEEETLAQRRKRLAAKDGGELALPTARPVSGAFSVEVLSQFGDLDEGKAKKEAAAPKEGEEETLGQRRRRLQAEKMAREEEMGIQGPSGGVYAGGAVQHADRRLSMASVLGAHLRKSPDLRVQEERLRREQEEMIAREQEAKMAAMRMQMPQTLVGPGKATNGGFRGGMYNDGTGGVAQQPPSINQYQPNFAQPTMFSNSQGPVGYNQASYVNNGYASNSFNMSTQSAPMMMGGQMMGYQQQPMYANFGGYNAGMAAYSQMNLGMYQNRPGNMHANGGMMHQQMQVPGSSGSLDAVERWRQGIRP